MEHLFTRHPDDHSKTVEYFLEKPAGRGPWPTIILLHGYQASPSVGGEFFVQSGVLDKYAKRGYLAVAVSEPGFGSSTGPPDFCGPFTVDAVLGVLAKLQDERLASRSYIVVEGISRGALVAGLLGARDPSVAGLVLISGVYDLEAFVKEAKSNDSKDVARSISKETGGSAKALRQRSVLDHAQYIKAFTLILNGAKDDRTDPSQARKLADVINAHGGRARAIIYPNYGHYIPVEVRDKIVDPFIDKALSMKVATAAQ